MRVIMLYLPVIHQGYLELLDRHNDVDCVCLVGDNLLRELDETLWRKDLRRLPASVVVPLLGNLITKPVTVIDSLNELAIFAKAVSVFVMNEDELMRKLVDHLDLYHCVTWDGAFLRWDRKRIVEPDKNVPERVATVEDLAVINVAQGLATRSSDWWLKVGVCVVGAKKEGVELSPFGTFNYHPNRSPDYFGDVRLFCKAGENPEIGTAIHAERRLISICAKEGISLLGASLYVTTFPCASCASMVAEAGVARCYFVSGYSNLLGGEVLTQAGVELFRLVVPTI